MTDNTTPPRTMLDLAPSLGQPGVRLVDAGQIYDLFNSLFSVQTIPATGTTRLNANQITTAINLVLSASGSQFGLILPPGIVGKQVTVINNASVALSIYPYKSFDFVIPAGSANPSSQVSQAATSTAMYICILVNTNVVPIVTYWKQVGVTGM